jgi:hypothetical protein
MGAERDEGEMDHRLDSFLRLIVQPSAFVLGLTLTFFPNPGDLTALGRIVAVIGMASLALSVATNFVMAYVGSITSLRFRRLAGVSVGFFISGLICLVLVIGQTYLDYSGHGS